MREIKFRGKRVDNGEWVYGYYFKTPLTDEATGSKPEEGWFFLTERNRFCIAQDGSVYEVILETIGQFTGLYDKNGKEIYEGDIYKDCEGKRITVVWKDNGFKGLYISHRTYEGEPYAENVYLELRHTNDKRWGIEVIGDIYNNPELLESGE